MEIEHLKEKVFFRDSAGDLFSFDQYHSQRSSLKGAQIGEYFSFMEPRFLQDIQDYGCLEVNIPLVYIMDAFRTIADRPVMINSFNRDDIKQKMLFKEGYKTAKFSPHVVKLGADIDTYTKEQTIREVKILERISSDFGIPIRIGYKSYLKNGQTFIHLDVCPLYFSPGMPWHNHEHPWQWEREARW